MLRINDTHARNSVNIRQEVHEGVGKSTVALLTGVSTLLKLVTFHQLEICPV